MKIVFIEIGVYIDIEDVDIYHYNFIGDIVADDIELLKKEYDAVISNKRLGKGEWIVLPNGEKFWWVK